MGGVSLFVCFPHSKGSPISSNCSESLSCLHRGKFSANQGKKWQKLDFICSPWCFVGILGDRKGQNTNIFLKCGCRLCRSCLPFGVSTGAGLRGCRTCGVLALVFWSCVPPFCPLSRFVFGVLSLNMALFRVLRGFLEGFPCWMYVCIACVLCVACVAFVCVNS